MIDVRIPEVPEPSTLWTTAGAIIVVVLVMLSRLGRGPKK